MTDPDPISRWHEVVRTRDTSLVPALLADDVVFRSPAVHAPQAGRDRTTAYLAAAIVVLGPGLTYHREWQGDSSAVLEFTTQIDGIDVHGVDMIAWDGRGLITEFTVMVRPMKGLQVLVEHMGAELSRSTA